MQCHLKLKCQNISSNIVKRKKKNKFGGKDVGEKLGEKE